MPDYQSDPTFQMLLQFVGAGQPDYGVGFSDEMRQAMERAAAQRAAAGAPLGSYGRVAPTMDPNVERLQNAAADLAADMLANPSRYDTALFQQLLDLGLERMGQEQQRDMLDITRRANQFLGPQSGQLKNEYIDLANAYDLNRRELLGNLLREAALTQAQDRLAALSGAGSVASDIFERGAALRGEERQERQFEFGRDLANREIAQRAAQMEQSALESLYGIESGLRNEQRSDRLARLGELLGLSDAALRTQQSLYEVERGLRNEQRGDRLQQLTEMFNFAELDRLLGRDAMEDYFRQQGLDLGYLDWFLDYINTVTGLPGAVDTGEGGAGGTGGTGGGSLPPGETVFWSGTAQVASHDVPVRVTSDGTAWVQWGGKWRAVEMDANGRQYITVHDGQRRYFDVPVNFPKPPSQSGGSQGGGQAQTVKIKGKEYQTRTNAGGVQEVFFQNQHVSGQWLPVKTDSKGRKYIEWRLRVGPFSQKVKEYLD